MTIPSLWRFPHLMPFRLSRGPGLTPSSERYLEITAEEFWGAWAALQVQIQQAVKR